MWKCGNVKMKNSRVFQITWAVSTSSFNNHYPASGISVPLWSIQYPTSSISLPL